MSGLEFVLGVAASVLANAISSLFTQKRESIEKSEIRCIVQEVVQQVAAEKHVDVTVLDIMKEVHSLAGEIPDLVVFPDRIELRSTLRAQLDAFPETIPVAIRERLDQLDTLVQQRYQQQRHHGSNRTIDLSPVPLSLPQGRPEAPQFASGIAKQMFDELEKLVSEKRARDHRRGH